MVGGELARRVVRLWAFFAAQEPYDDGGVLKEEWRRRLDPHRTDLEDPLCWGTFVCGSMLDHFINHQSRPRMSQTALATPGILEAGAGTRKGEQEDAGVDEDTVYVWLGTPDSAS